MITRKDISSATHVGGQLIDIIDAVNSTYCN
jgi:hypothetical protein